MLETLARKFIPRKWLTAIKFYHIFHHFRGHSRFCDGLAVDGDGKNLPWFTYACIDFLKRLDVSQCTVFEFGAGSSTLFWSTHCESVTSVEKDRQWYGKIKRLLPNSGQISLQQSDTAYADAILKHNPFDIIVIDGARRDRCAINALKRVTEQSLIILDNSEWDPNTANFLACQGFTRIDFSGFGPINAFPSCTSLFFKPNSPLVRNRRPEQGWKPAGGRFLTAYDDTPENCQELL